MWSKIEELVRGASARSMSSHACNYLQMPWHHTTHVVVSTVLLLRFLHEPQTEPKSQRYILFQSATVMIKPYVEDHHWWLEGTAVFRDYQEARGMLIVFFNSHRVVQEESVQEVQTIKTELYYDIARCLRENIWCKLPELWRDGKNVKILGHSN